MAQVGYTTSGEAVKRISRPLEGALTERSLPGIPGSADAASDLHAQPEGGGRGTGRRVRRPARLPEPSLCERRPGEVPWGSAGPGAQDGRAPVTIGPST